MTRITTVLAALIMSVGCTYNTDDTSNGIVDNPLEGIETKGECAASDACVSFYSNVLQIDSDDVILALTNEKGFQTTNDEDEVIYMTIGGGGFSPILDLSVNGPLAAGTVHEYATLTGWLYNGMPISLWGADNALGVNVIQDAIGRVASSGVVGLEFEVPEYNPSGYRWQVGASFVDTNRTNDQAGQVYTYTFPPTMTEVTGGTTDGAPWGIPEDWADPFEFGTDVVDTGSTDIPVDTDVVDTGSTDIPVDTDVVDTGPVGPVLDAVTPTDNGDGTWNCQSGYTFYGFYAPTTGSPSTSGADACPSAWAYKVAVCIDTSVDSSTFTYELVFAALQSYGLQENGTLGGGICENGADQLVIEGNQAEASYLNDGILAYTALAWCAPGSEALCL